jgi:hypothetical protein
MIKFERGSFAVGSYNFRNFNVLGLREPSEDEFNFLGWNVEYWLR